MRFCQASCHFLDLRSKYSSHHPVLKILALPGWKMQMKQPLKQEWKDLRFIAVWRITSYIIAVLLRRSSVCLDVNLYVLCVRSIGKDLTTNKWLSGF
jgi:hypothetical protein